MEGAEAEVLDPGREGWLAEAARRLDEEGFAVIGGVLPPGMRAEADAALLRARERVRAEAGAEALEAARRRGDSMIRFLEREEPVFLETLALPPVLALVEAFLGPAAILRFQMGNVMAPAGAGDFVPSQPQGWHRNFARRGAGPRLTLEMALNLEEMTPDTGGLLVAPGSHRWEGEPARERLEAAARPVPGPAGSLQVLAGTLWHRESRNLDRRERRTLVQQYGQPWMKPYVDHLRMLGAERAAALPERTRRLLGWEARVPATPREFYRPPGERLFHAEGGA
ncbi:MAG: phytanoyl-CoA dioxygenase family protein [Planctomycetes bacterium]|nr:phytanoyl-CoA dioxygenase family protein [Planctomycetota bacterium]